MMTLEVIKRNDGKELLELKDDLWLLQELNLYSPEGVKEAGEQLIGRVTAGIQAYINREVSNYKS